MFVCALNFAMMTYHLQIPGAHDVQTFRPPLLIVPCCVVLVERGHFGRLIVYSNTAFSKSTTHKPPKQPKCQPLSYS